MPLHTIALLLLAVLLGAAGLRMIRLYVKYAGPRAVTCPETRAHAAVTLQRGATIRTGLLGTPNLELGACSRWPERAGCGQECTAEIAADPEASLARIIAGRWFEGKKCITCNLEFHKIEWQVAKPALVLADKSCVEWDRVPVDKLPEALADALPLCCTCFLASKMVAERPDLVLKRPAFPKSGSREV
ncbi:MAG TPA: hypothetical protein VN736_30315 [Candidatus Limnocylindrales bacterium]|nr:hypothetical protein [Candidatus Limnocylindrales bacterium]